MVLESYSIVHPTFLIMQVCYLNVFFELEDNRIQLLFVCLTWIRILSFLLPCVGNKAVGVMKAGQTFTIEPMINAGK